MPGIHILQRLGVFHLMADGAKFLFKEEPTPQHVNKFYFILAPIVAMIPAYVPKAQNAAAPRVERRRRGGIGQAVILAAGLDARAYRLPWPQGTVVYESSLGPSGQEGSGLPQPGTPGTYLVGRFSIVVP